MTMHVFVGPTLPVALIPAELGAIVHGPARFGDVYRVARTRPRTIAIIDGYFEHVPAVWHKEVLWALSEGIAVVGASSMGALRAAELAPFGMVGVGTVFELFRRGELEDDDEVAVVHGPPELGYEPLSEAMVNIRATLAAAVSDGVIGQAVADELVAAGKARFYAERTFKTLLLDGAARQVDRSALDGLAAWLPRSKRDQKRADALLLLEQLARPAEPVRASFHFEPTDAWCEAVRTWSDEPQAGLSLSRTDESVLDELRLVGEFASLQQIAAASAAGIERAIQAGVEVERSLVRSAIDDLRRRHGLAERADFRAWCAGQGLEGDELERFLRDQARVHWAKPLTEAAAASRLVDELRVAGDYARLRARALAKAKVLADAGADNLSSSELGMTEAELWRWYFTVFLRRPEPDDIERYATSSGFDGVDELRVAVVRELCYSRSSAPLPPAAATRP
jgi:hypothetical protein